MAQMTIDGRAVACELHENYEDVLRRELGVAHREALGVRIGGRSLPLRAQVQDGAQLALLTIHTEEGRRIYERSLRFVLLMAVRALYPKARVRIENSTSGGVYAKVDDLALNEAVTADIAQKMRQLVACDLPFEKQVIPRERAIEHFSKEGATDKVRLLTYRPFEHFQMYRCDGMLEYFYGEMAPSTGYVPVFSLEYYQSDPGLQLLLPNPADPARPIPFLDQPKLHQTFAQSTRWANILGCDNVADLNEMVNKKRLREFIRVNEALQEQAIFSIATKFIESGAQLILIAGPSSSGKTTFTHRLSIALRVLGKQPNKISLDDYYVNRDSIPLDEYGERDLERLDTLDVPLFNEHLVRIIAGECVGVPLYDFVSGTRMDKTHPTQIAPGEPILVEGIHALNPELTHSVSDDKKFRIYISALTTLNLDDHNRIRTTDMRLLRRMVRDHQFRGTKPEQTLSMWDSVRRGEERFIFPFQENADIMFNSTLVYESAILKKYAYPMLSAVPEDSPFYTRSRRLVKFLNYIQSADVEDEIPINSILREFIGGCCFYRDED